MGEEIRLTQPVRLDIYRRYRLSLCGGGGFLLLSRSHPVLSHQLFDNTNARPCTTAGHTRSGMLIQDVVRLHSYVYVNTTVHPTAG